jgi:Tol biopolymer transport system component
MSTTTDQRSTLVHRFPDWPRHRVLALVVALTAAVALASSALAITVNGAGDQSPLRHAIVFTRFVPGADMGDLYRIDAGETVEQLIRPVFDAAILSPDGTRFLDFAPTPDDRGSTAIYNVDGSGYEVLPIPDPTLNLPGGAWLGNSMIAMGGWGLDYDLHGVGIYARRSSDGGGLIKLTDPGESHDAAVKSSPDGSKLLFFRPSSKRDLRDSAPQDAFVVGADGIGLTRLSPPGTTTAFVFGTHEAVSWSPDSSKVAIVLANGPFWNDPSRSVYVVKSDGSGLTRIGPRGDIWDAIWSPDGRWIAFTLATKASNGLHELYLMHPDGSGLHRLVSASDGLISTQPFWSRGSDQLLFKRFTNDPGFVNLWSVNVDGSQLYQVTHEPGEYRGLAWLP